MAKTLVVPGRRVGTAQSRAAHVRAQLMALSSSFDSVLVRAKGVSLQPTCVRMLQSSLGTLVCQKACAFAAGGTTK